jgi:short-subunit dehydrogenase
MNLEGKAIIITGASSGIGKAVAIGLARYKSKLILASRNIEKLEELKNICTELGSIVFIKQTDVTNQSEIYDLFKFAVEKYEKIDVVFDNAGLGYVKPLIDLSTNEIQEMINVNVTGMISVAKSAAEHMKNNKSGHIIMTSSIAGLIAVPDWSVYVASKWAITGFADCLRAELGRYNIKVSTVHPGVVDTEFFDQGKANLAKKDLGKMLDVNYVADEIIKIMFTNKKMLILPKSYKTIWVLYKMFPGLMMGLLSRFS